MKKQNIEVIDLFCGAGGLSYGLKQAGLNILAGVDFNKNCKYPYEANKNGTFIHKDLAELKTHKLLSLYSENAIKVLVGCAPCQPFSSCATKVKDKENDHRWNLLGEFGRLIEGVQPDIVSMENVPSLKNKSPFYKFVEILKKNNYYVEYSITNCDEYEVPQSRKRLTLLASKFGILQLQKNPNPKKTVRDAIAHLPKINAGKDNCVDPIHKSAQLTEINIKRIKASKPGRTWKDWDVSLLPECYKKESGKGFHAVYGRLEWDKPSPTLTTNFTQYGTGRYGHPEQNRALSMREGAILQGFPENYKFADPKEPIYIKRIAQHIGNAVPPKLGQYIGLSIIKHLKEYDTKSNYR